jgi:hypothetical protein
VWGQDPNALCIPGVYGTLFNQSTPNQTECKRKPKTEFFKKNFVSHWSTTARCVLVVVEKMWSLRERMRDGLRLDKPKTTPNVKEDERGEIFSSSQSLENLPARYVEGELKVP